MDEIQSSFFDFATSNQSGQEPLNGRIVKIFDNEMGKQAISGGEEAWP